MEKELTDKPFTFNTKISYPCGLGGINEFWKDPTR